MASALRPSACCIARRQAPGWTKCIVAQQSAFAAALKAKASNARALPHMADSRISAVHADVALAHLAGVAAFPPLPGLSASGPASLAGAWAARQRVAASCATRTGAHPGLSEHAEDVLPRLPAAIAEPYLPPARREGACRAVLAGCAQTCPAPAQPAQQPAAYVPPHRRTAEQQAAAAEAGRPGKPCPFPCLTAGPMLQPAAEAPLPLYLLALLYPSRRC